MTEYEFDLLKDGKGLASNYAVTIYIFINNIFINIIIYNIIFI